MKEITFLYMQGCPYCRNAKQAMAELREEEQALANIPVRALDIDNDVEAQAFASQYEYVPTMFIDKEKLYEAHPEETYAETKAKVRMVLQKASV